MHKFVFGDRVKIVGTDATLLSCSFVEEELIGAIGIVTDKTSNEYHIHVRTDSGYEISCMPPEALVLVKSVNANKENTMQNARNELNNLTVDSDTLLLREAGFEDTDGTRTCEGTEATLDMLYRDTYREKLIAGLKLAKSRKEKAKPEA